MAIAIIVVVVLSVIIVIASNSKSGSAANPMDQPPVPLNDSDRARIVELLQNGKKIDAIKLYRDATHHHLKEAKDAVEAIERQG